MAEKVRTPPKGTVDEILQSTTALSANENLEESVKKGKRRSKKDKTARNFVCGCGKQYLSYPALYTHLKTKHDGIQPAGTKCQLNLKNSKRGRPKKIDIHNVNENGVAPNSEALSAYADSFLAPFLGENLSIMFKSIVEKYDLVSLKYYGCNGKTDPTIGFPVIYLCNESKPMLHPLLLIIQQLAHIKENKNAKTVLKTKNPCCDILMALFLFCVSKYSNEKFYLVMGIFFRNLRECLNKHGYDVLIEYLKKNTTENIGDLLARKKEGNAFTETENCEYLPLISEKFIQEYLPTHCPNFDPNVAIDYMYDFSNWLSKKQFSRVKVRFEDESANITSKIEALKNL